MTGNYMVLLHSLGRVARIALMTRLTLLLAGHPEKEVGVVGSLRNTAFFLT